MTPNLGSTPNETDQRDAVHVAVIPVIAGEWLAPGSQVGLTTPGNLELVGNVPNPIGVIDPFLREPIGKGERAWMLMYPGIVHPIRHEWSHPALTSAEVMAEAKHWLGNFAREFMDWSYEELMRNVCEHCLTGKEFEVSESTRNSWYKVRAKFWKHYATVTGDHNEDRDSFMLYCSC